MVLQNHKKYKTTLLRNHTRYPLLPFSPTNGKDQVKTSMKFGSQYGCGEQLNWRIFITLFSYFNTAAATRSYRYGNNVNEGHLTAIICCFQVVPNETKNNTQRGRD